MCDCLAHRGSDAEGIWEGKNAIIGHRRLAVIDPLHANQLMIAHNRFFLTYNGELYNTNEIKGQLQQKGYLFKTSSDTEVLLYAVIEWREEVVNYLNGIFTFAVWDETNEVLCAFRDRLGVKPFYYAYKGGQFTFASEIKAILQNINITSSITYDGLRSLLSIGPSHHPGETIHKDIDELLPGHFITLSKGDLQIKSYWSIENKSHEHSLEETSDYLILFIRGRYHEAISERCAALYISLRRDRF